HSAPMSSKRLSAVDGDDIDDVFTPLEAKIRDAYDTFLDYLERFASLIELRLVNAEEFEPCLSYWINGIEKNEHPEIDATWRCTLLTYINFYGYPGVRRLFAAYGKDISPDGPLYQELIGELKKIQKTKIDRRLLAERLYSSVVTTKNKLESRLD